MIRLYDKVTFDLKSSVREKMPNGYLYVRKNNLTKNQVSPYMGHELGALDEVGWNPEKQYGILRDGDELAKAAPAYRALPLLMGHWDTTPENLPKETIIGSIGTNVCYDGGYIQGDLVVWDAEAIRAIEAGEIQELSCGYAYDLDPTPGDFEGTAYDGVMRNIRPEHVALVEAGRAGSEVRVADEALDGDKPGHALHGNQYLGGTGAAAKKAAPGGTTTVAKKKGEKKVKTQASPEERVSATKDIAKRTGVSPKAGVKQYGEVSFADPKNKKYPLDTPKHVRAALSYWGMPKNRAKYAKADQAQIGKRIHSAAKRLGIHSSTGDTAGHFKETTMAKATATLSPLAHRVAGAAQAFLRTKLAADSVVKPADLMKITCRVSDAKFKKQLDGVVGTIKDKYKLADSDELRKLLLDMMPEEGMSEDEDDEDDKDSEDEDSEDEDDKASCDEDDEDDEAGESKAEALKEKMKAKKAGDQKKAADALVMANDIRRQIQGEFKALRQAEKDTEGLIGDVEGLDTAEAIYRYALDQKGVDHKGIKEVKALAALVKLASRDTARPAFAADEAAPNVKTFERFPALAKISHQG